MKKNNSLRLVGRYRRQYLEFLRNITPQIILFTLVLIFGTTLDFSKLDLRNWLHTALFFLFSVAFGFAFMANSYQLIRVCYGDMNRWFEKIYFKSKLNKKCWHKQICYMFYAISKGRGLVVLEFIFAVVLIVAIYAVLIAFAIKSYSEFK